MQKSGDYPWTHHQRSKEVQMAASRVLPHRGPKAHP